MAPFIHLIADYGAGDPAFSEVVHRLRAHAPNVAVQPTPVPPFSTVATGFWIEQLGIHNPAFEELFIYSNTAPRTKAAGGNRADVGGELCFITLDTGVPVVAVDAGYNLSFVRDRIVEYRSISLPSTDAQFRSRDYFPDRVIELVNGNRGSLADTRSVADLPAKPEAVVCHVDGYGNIKTSIRASTFQPAKDELAVEIGGVTDAVSVTSGISAIPVGRLGMIPGSAGGDDPYMELLVRGGSAADRFEQPEPGAELTFH